MAQPILTRNSKVIDITSGVTTSSSLVDVSDCTALAIQAVWSGTSPSGTVTIEASLDGVNFSTYGASSISVTGASGSGVVNSGPIGFPFVRATFTYTSGTVASLKVYLSSKQTG
jgi:hypothetical protein